MFTSMDYPFEDEAFGRLAADEVDALVGPDRGPPEHGRPVRQQRGRAAGRDARPRSRARADPVLRRDRPGDRTGGRPRRGLRSVGAVRRRASDRSGPRRHDYYGVGGYRAPSCPTRGRAASGSRPSASRSRTSPTRRLSPTLVPEPPYEAFVHHPHWKAGVARDCRIGLGLRRPARLSTSRSSSSGSTRTAPRGRPRPVSRAVTRGHAAR